MKLEDVIQQLKGRREQWGLTQREVADATGWHQQQLQAYESGSKKPGFEQLALWAAALKMDLVLAPEGLSIPEAKLSDAISLLVEGWGHASATRRWYIANDIRIWREGLRAAPSLQAEISSANKEALPPGKKPRAKLGR